jgi:hypothetical protein
MIAKNAKIESQMPFGAGSEKICAKKQKIIKIAMQCRA